MALSHIYKNEIQRSRLFSNLGAETVSQLFESAKILYKRAGDPLFRKGEAADCFFIIRTGSAKQFLTSPDGHEKTLEVMRPSAAVAEVTMFLEASEHACDCEMLEDGELFRFNNSAYLKALQKHPASALPLIADLSYQIRRQTEEIGNLALTDARHRLTHYLFQQLECEEKSDCQPLRNGCPGNNHCALTLPTSKSVIASLLSIQRETFSRTLRKMKDEQMIEVKGDRINILDLQRLRESLT